MPKIYEVGGSVRDRFLGLENKDEDFVFVITPPVGADLGFKIMRAWLLDRGYKIFLETPNCFTIRAKHSETNKVHDYVLSRKELEYYPGTRKPKVVSGTLYQDLERRDFTMNAIARNPDTGEIIDPFFGRQDLEQGIIRTPLNSMKTLKDDPLRALRAVRFKIKLPNFRYDEDLKDALSNPKLPTLMEVVSTDRIREELQKCFSHNNWKTWKTLNELPNSLVKSWLDRPRLWLKPTTKK